MVRVGVLLEEFLRSRGNTTPRIAVAGLNTHAGESGKLGIEGIVKSSHRQFNTRTGQSKIEDGESKIVPLGPVSPDTVFHRAIEGELDAGGFCMYHDQGLIPLKLHAFHSGVNVTLGRTVSSHQTVPITALHLKLRAKASRAPTA